MMLIPKNRLWVTGSAMLLAALLGVAGGYLVGRAHAQRTGEDSLAAQATEISVRLDALLNESRSLLAVLNASPYPACSREELAWFRILVFQSANIRDAGRMRSGQLECSADFRTDAMPTTQHRPASTLSDGENIYKNPPPYTPRQGGIYLVQQGGSYVVADPGVIRSWQVINKTVEVYLWDGFHVGWQRASGISPRFSAAISSHDGQDLVGDTLYATHCSSVGPSCVVTYGSLAATLLAGRKMLVLHSAFGGLLGAFLVLAFVLLYQSNRSMTQQLRRAIRHDELRLLYQPILDLDSDRVVGAEALARWTDEDGYVVGPEVFVRLAEELGFVGELTEKVVRQALADFGGYLRANPDFRLNVNVTATDLADVRLLPMLENALAEAGVAPQSLVIEITESSTARRKEAIAAIQELRQRGHAVEIDDFGTGYSSLACLRELSVDAIKIDKSFTHAIGTEAVTGNILPQILAMAETLHLQVIVEGIETEEQVRYFAGLAKPMLGQGWAFGRPLPILEFLRDLALRQEGSKQSASGKDVQTVQ